MARRTERVEGDEAAQQEEPVVEVVQNVQSQKSRPDVPPGCRLIRILATGVLEVRMPQTAMELISRGQAEDVTTQRAV